MSAQFPNQLPQCNGCAFRKGTEAHGSPFTLLKGVLCAETGEPFYCHERLENGKPNTLCAGWVSVMDGHRKTRGTPEPTWKVLLRNKLLRLIITEEDRLLDGKPASTEEAFVSMVRAAVGEVAIEAGVNVASVFASVEDMRA